MILYHGSYVVVDKPQIIKTEKGRDFGFAFYLTPIKEQAERMAIRKQKQMQYLNKKCKPIVSIFNWDEDKLNVIYKYYPSADLEWLEMILKCRNDVKYVHGFDIVEGKIADDSVGETILFVMEGIMRKEDALDKLKFQHINSQIAFCTDKSLSHLQYVESYEVKL